MQHQLRNSFQQLVVNHQPQAQVAGLTRSRLPSRPHSRLRRSSPPATPSPLLPSSDAATGRPSWALHAVRADQASDTADTATIQIISDITRDVDGLHTAALARNAALAAQGGSSVVQGDAASVELRRKVMASVVDLQAGLLERETEVRSSNYNFYKFCLGCLQRGLEYSGRCGQRRSFSCINMDEMCE